MEKAEYIVTISKGIAEISAGEVRDIIGVKPEIGDNILFFKSKVDDIVRLVLLGRTIYKVIHILDMGVFNSLEDIARKVEKLDFRPFGGDYKFALRTTRYGEHEFTSLDANRVVGASIYRALKRSGYRPEVDLTYPDIEYVLRIIGDQYIFGVNLVGDGLHIRGYRVYNHPASIKTSLAAAMVLLSGFKEENIIDPMAGGGTIPIEAALIKYRIPPGIFRGEHPLIKIPFYGEDLYYSIRSETLNQVIHKEYGGEIIYNDISTRHFIGAMRNAESAGVKKYIKFYNHDARELTKYIDLSGGIAIFNPPYGIRMTRRDAIEDLYRDVINELKLLDIDKLVVITSEYRLLKKALYENGYNIIKHYMVLHGKLTAHISLASL